MWLGQRLKHEIYLSYYYTKSNLDASLTPYLTFTTASLLHREAGRDEYLFAISHALIYGFLYTYTFDLANNALGDNQEDQINKPDRPIVSKMTTVSATKTRYYISSVGWLLYSYYLDVHGWALMWCVLGIVTHVLHLARYWPTKEISLALGAIAQLMVSWRLGGSEPEAGWMWVKIIVVWILFTVAIQDFRDVPGDRACGRWTAPILFGDTPARISSICGLIILDYVYLIHWVLAFRFNMATLMMSIVVIGLTLFVIYRVALLRTIKSDRVSYRWYVFLYNSLLLSACVSIGTY